MTGHPKQFVLYKDGAGEFRWTLYAANSKKIADCGEGYTTRAGCVDGMCLVVSTSQGTPVNEAVTGREKQFVVYKDKAGEFRWTLYAANLKKIADSGEGYKNRLDCVGGCHLVATTVPGIRVNDRTTDTWFDL